MATICLFPPSPLRPFYAPIPGYGYKIDIANERAADFQGITRKRGEEGGYRRENSCLALAQFIAVLFSSVRVRFKVRSYIFRFSPYESVFFSFFWSSNRVSLGIEIISLISFFSLSLSIRRLIQLGYLISSVTYRNYFSWRREMLLGFNQAEDRT